MVLRMGWGIEQDQGLAMRHIHTHSYTHTIFIHTYLQSSTKFVPPLGEATNLTVVPVPVCVCVWLCMCLLGVYVSV